MNLKLGDTAPDFEAETTEGTIAFHDWIGDSWAVLFSHPKDFTPVCTTELGYMANIKPEFDRRNVKIIGLSVDPVDRHTAWASDIAETQGTRPELPDHQRWGLHRLQALRDAPGGRLGRPDRAHARGQPDRAQRLRRRPGQEDQADPRLPDVDRAELRRGAAGDRLAPADRAAQRLDTRQLEGRRPGDHLRVPSRTTRRRSSGPRAGRSRSPTSASFPSRTRPRSSRRAPARPVPRRRLGTGFRTCGPAARA